MIHGQFLESANLVKVWPECNWTQHKDTGITLVPQCTNLNTSANTARGEEAMFHGAVDVKMVFEIPDAFTRLPSYKIMVQLRVAPNLFTRTDIHPVASFVGSVAQLKPSYNFRRAPGLLYEDLDRRADGSHVEIPASSVVISHLLINDAVYVVANIDLGVLGIKISGEFDNMSDGS
jgi:hypothetical protein